MSARLVVRMMVVLAVVLSFAGTVFGASTFGVNAERAKVGDSTIWSMFFGNNLAVDGTTVYAAYCERNAVFGPGMDSPVIVRSTDSGDSWDIKSYISSQSCNAGCRLAIGGGPRPTNSEEKLLHVIWVVQSSPTLPYTASMYYARAFIPTTSDTLDFSTPLEIVGPLPMASAIGPLKTVVDAFGNFHIMYHNGISRAVYSLRISEDAYGEPLVEGPVALAENIPSAKYDIAAVSGHSYAVCDRLLYRKNYSANYASTNWVALGNYYAPYEEMVNLPSILVKDPQTVMVADEWNGVGVNYGPYVSVTEDGGYSWTQHYFPLLENGTMPRLALEAGGSVAVVWHNEDIVNEEKILFSRGSKTGNKWSFTTPSYVLQNTTGMYPDVISLPGVNKALILYFDNITGVIYSTKEQ